MKHEGYVQGEEMSRLSSFFLGIVVGAALLYVSMHYYIVRSNEGVSMIPKMNARLENPYVDIRSFSLDDWQQHQTLALAIMKANKGDLMTGNAMDGFKASAQRTLDELSGKAKSVLGW